jgi:hypothetical protein
MLLVPDWLGALHRPSICQLYRLSPGPRKQLTFRRPMLTVQGFISHQPVQLLPAIIREHVVAKM